jgi:hypothetical protein
VHVQLLVEDVTAAAESGLAMADIDREPCREPSWSELYLS